MPVIYEMVHVVVVPELLESLDKLAATEESEVEEGDMLVWDQFVGSCLYVVLFPGSTAERHMGWFTAYCQK